MPIHIDNTKLCYTCGRGGLSEDELTSNVTQLGEVVSLLQLRGMSIKNPSTIAQRLQSYIRALEEEVLDLQDSKMHSQEGLVKEKWVTDGTLPGEYETSKSMKVHANGMVETTRTTVSHPIAPGQELASGYYKCLPHYPIPEYKAVEWRSY